MSAIRKNGGMCLHAAHRGHRRVDICDALDAVLDLLFRALLFDSNGRRAEKTIARDHPRTTLLHLESTSHHQLATRSNMFNGSIARLSEHYHLTVDMCYHDNRYQVTERLGVGSSATVWAV